MRQALPPATTACRTSETNPAEKPAGCRTRTGKYHGKDVFLSEALTIEAEKALDNARTTDKPFFLYMAHYAIHTPIQPDMRFYQNIWTKDFPR